MEELRSKYKALSKRDKPAYTEEMVRIIKGQYHGRFLKKASNVETSNSPDSANGYEEGVEFHWIEVDDEVAKDKVGHSFRTTPKKKPVTASTVFFHGEASPDVWLTEVDNDLELRYTLGQSMEGGLTLNGKRAKTCTDDSKESNTDGISQEFYDKLFGGFT